MTDTYQPREDVAQLLRGGATYASIRQTLGVSSGVIAATRKAFDIPTRPGGPGYRPTPEARAANEMRTLQLLLTGASYRQIEDEVGISRPTIFKIRVDAGLPAPVVDHRMPSRTVAETLALYTQAYGDGHLRWTGPSRGRAPQLSAEGRRLNVRRVTFEAHHGRRAVGYLIPQCGEDGCIAGAHLADTRQRHGYDHHAPPRPQP